MSATKTARGYITKPMCSGNILRSATSEHLHFMELPRRPAGIRPNWIIVLNDD